MDLATEFSPFQEKLTAALVQATKTTSQLLAQDIAFQRSVNPSLSNSLDEQSARFLGLTNSILRFATSGSDLNAPSLEDEDGVDDNWRGVVDVIDELLEKADACLDEFTGIIKKLGPSQDERGQELNKRASKAQFPGAYNFASSKIPKPQLSFKTRPNNHASSPFRPILRQKPHALIPLPPVAEQTSTNGDVEQSEHPYAHEIKDCHYPASTYSSSTPQLYKPFESTTATFVNTIEGVKVMLEELKSAKEIAVDLEHHDAHSYHGLVCLMQISTREKDWIVDTLLPWREELQILNEVFADPRILKVLHGSSMDVIWLQRDLGLYLVGLFDTYHASVALNYPKKSLKFLLDKFVNLEAEKQYQTADWRLRPLLPGMFDYARSDTHYLLYIYDNLRNELIEKSTPDTNLIDYVQDKSKEEALQRYERPVYDAETGQGSGGWYDVLSRSPSLLNREQLAVFKAVHRWRDQTARTDDEGVQSVLSKRALFAIAHGMPSDQAGLLKLAIPVSPSLRKRLSELLKVIKDAKASGVDGPELHEVLASGPATLVSGVKAMEPSPAGAEKEASMASSAKAVRALVSQFWGTTLEQTESTNASVYAPFAAADALALSLPLPSMPINISEEAHGIEDEAMETSATPPAPKSETEEDRTSGLAADQIFTVKQFGAGPKRKAAPADTERSPAPSPVSNSPRPDVAGLGSKKQKTSAAEDVVAPFDYTNAESVLQAGRAEDVRNLPRKPQFNPYAKVLDAPQALRKSKKDMGGGKSFTFQK
ncbi:3'-5' exonuclease family protein [Coccidioides posadasii C735 delta SOWgp]|uniref:3'-5' exonuclease family protein n=1 Tax=Coccidioides posadasii (strain C735) TaxID=222929 RepID=C5PEZ0_COCP7|nr:exosome component 3'-5' exonuclease [Coccidioides posadasii C735 delta SOWgp]EER23208.1 3'-5' exonuclease family protein [Coccidioides posadasii C735 delta SOWgp]|eukprot:XP_003065353.1 exosome component 3'-5' exonuclease [Coccidioides posadasii C735 delta SOWgp]